MKQITTPSPHLAFAIHTSIVTGILTVFVAGMFLLDPPAMIQSGTARSLSGSARVSLLQQNSSWYFTAYPNPAHDVVNIEWRGPDAREGKLLVENLTSHTTCEIVLPAGKSILSVDVSTWAPGTYQLVSGEGETLFSRSLVVE